MFLSFGLHFDLVNERNDVSAVVVEGYLIRNIHVEVESNHAINAWEITENVDRAIPVTFDFHNYLIKVQVFGHRN